VARHRELPAQGFCLDSWHAWTVGGQPPASGTPPCIRALKETFVEIKIGIQHTARELNLESNLSAEEVEAAVAAAIKDGGVLTLVDDKERKVLVPGDKIAYVELGEPTGRRVGFGAI
jgi:hypothetical protein